MEQFRELAYEERSWKPSIDIDALSRRQRQRILPTYQSAVPIKISNVEFPIPSDLSVAIDDLLIKMSRFDGIQSTKSFNFPAVLLRSESSASSQIENLTSSVRNVALAELSDKAPKNAKIISGNLAAMREALGIDVDKKITMRTILKVHQKLIEPTKESFGGEIRNEPVWVGGTPYSPHDAIFVPPHQDKIMDHIDDLLEFLERSDVNVIVKTAVFHAQFETIHPFIDGNGRTGRALLHKILRDENILLTVTLPISAGLLHDIDGYMSAIKSYQDGDYLPIVEEILDALELAIVIGELVTDDLEAVVSAWEERITEKKTASIWTATNLLVEQPVVDADFFSDKLGITPRASRNLLNRLSEYGILRRIGNSQRGVFYQADEIITVMEDVSDKIAIRRRG